MYNITSNLMQVAICTMNTLNRFKVYLTKILTSKNESVNGFGPLSIFVPEVCTIIGKVLCVSPDAGSPSVYVPMFSKHYLQVCREFDKSFLKVNSTAKVIIRSIHSMFYTGFVQYTNATTSFTSIFYVCAGISE